MLVLQVCLQIQLQDNSKTMAHSIVLLQRSLNRARTKKTKQQLQGHSIERLVMREVPSARWDARAPRRTSWNYREVMEEFCPEPGDDLAPARYPTINYFGRACRRRCEHALPPSGAAATWLSVLQPRSALAYTASCGDAAKVLLHCH